jgi:carbonic anhydrase/acetyltransferase-like protein (isoleucine patch superfamily)
VVPPRSLVAGVPAKVRRELSDDEVEHVRQNGIGYLEITDGHRDL